MLLFGDYAWNRRESKYDDIKAELSFEERLKKENGRKFWEDEIYEIPSHLPLIRVRDWNDVVVWVEVAVKEGKL